MVHRQWVLSILNLRSLSTTSVEAITINFFKELYFGGDYGSRTRSERRDRATS
jgi:hypothetical protein